MSNRLKLVLVLGTMILFSLTMTACNRERPAPASVVATPAARGTVAGPTVVAPVTTQSAVPAAEGGDANTASTPSAPATRPAAANQTSPAVTGRGETTTYTVGPGDTLLDIAVRFGTTTEAISQLNNLSDPNALTLGQKLLIPGKKSTPEPATAGDKTTPGSATTYTVRRGDTLGSIAEKFGTTIQELARLNDLADADNIIVGQHLKIPSGSKRTEPTPTTAKRRVYVIQRGDTLLSIAREHGLTVRQLQEANNIKDPARIYAGQTLVIP